jgi:hypothetical protein
MLLSPSKREYFAVDGPLGGASDGSVCGAENARDRDPTHGTNDYVESLKMMSAGGMKKIRRHMKRHRWA